MFHGVCSVALNTPTTQPFAGPDLESIREAFRRISPHIERTPVMISDSLDELAGAMLYFKCENLQLSGSFKIRGAANAVFSLSEAEAARGVVTHSSGNHGAALALAAKMRGIRAWIVVPHNAPKVKVRAVEAYGGEIIFCEPTLEAREAAAAEIRKQTGAVLIHPYDDDRVIAGQGTAALELLEEIPDLDVICAPVSGGGLLSGTAIAAKSLRPEMLVIGCEPANADDAARSLASGQIEPAATTVTMADGLRATLAPRTFAILRARVDRIALVSEAAHCRAFEMQSGTFRRSRRVRRAASPAWRGRAQSWGHSFRRKSRPGGDPRAAGKRFNAEG
jgi:threonine dehydratase